MADNLQRSRGRPGSYKFDRGGYPTEPGPYIGEVMNNHDPARSGRVQVYIPEFGTQDKSDSSSWRTVRYLSPFYGSTPHSGTTAGTGGYVGNANSYGMWFTVPDVGVNVLCFFVNGDANQGYYVGSVPNPDLLHMVPAVGASENFQFDNDQQAQKFARATRLPVTEINDKDEAIRESSQAYTQQRPVHSVVAATMYQQGVLEDRVRGPIGSSSNRESPSNVFGISTPGRPIYQSGISEQTIKASLDSGGTTQKDVKVVGRRGGHSFIMDDGDIEGNDNLVRIRTSKGHQITLSDDGNCMHVMHANGQTWIELGREGTVDIYSANSVNIRSQGDINLHADKDINMYAERNLNLHSKENTIIESQKNTVLSSNKDLSIYADKTIAVLSEGTLGLKGVTKSSLESIGPTEVRGSTVGLNTGSAVPVSKPASIVRTKLADTVYTSQGWSVVNSKLDSVCTRAPTHEPYAHHNKGVANKVEYAAQAAPAPPPPKVANKIAQTNNKKPQNTVKVEDLSSQSPVTEKIGSLSTTQAATVMAQKAKSVASAAGVSVKDAASLVSSAGVGKYGLKADVLEKSGYLKPGTVERFLDDPAKLESVLRNTSVWSGKDGVANLDTVLGNEKLQTAMQQETFNSTLTELKSKGVITGSEDPKIVASVMSVANDFGADNAANWVNGTESAIDGPLMENVARSAQYSVDFVDDKLNNVFSGASGLSVPSTNNIAGAVSSFTGDLGAAVSNIAGGASGALAKLTGGLGGSIGAALGNVEGLVSGLFKGGGIKTIVPPVVEQTVNRASVDADISSLIGNAKVPAPNYTGILNPANFQLPALSGLVSEGFLDSNGPVEICECSDPTIIGANKEECEAAGGIWRCYTVNNNNKGTIV